MSVHTHEPFLLITSMAIGSSTPWTILAAAAFVVVVTCTIMAWSTYTGYHPATIAASLREVISAFFGGGGGSDPDGTGEVGER